VNLNTEVGAFAASPGPFGTFDMGGNAFQWIEANYSGNRRGFMGTPWGGIPGYDWSEGLLSLNADGLPDPPSDEGDLVGFRVAEIPEPVSFALVGLGSLLVLFRRRIR